VGDGYVLEGDVELLGSLEQIRPDAVGYSLTLGNKLRGVELGDDGLEDFVADRREDTLIVVLAEGLRRGEVLC
jgi:hypothetical protein